LYYREFGLLYVQLIIIFAIFLLAYFFGLVAANFLMSVNKYSSPDNLSENFVSAKTQKSFNSFSSIYLHNYFIYFSSFSSYSLPPRLDADFLDFLELTIFILYQLY